MPPLEIINESRDDRKSYLPFKKMVIWFESLELGEPIKNSGGINVLPILPYECRI